MVAEGALLLLLLVIVTGLLRSHAEILRALHALGADIALADRHGSDATNAHVRRVPATLDPGAGTMGIVLDAVHGVTPAGEVARVALDRSGDVLLVFLSSGCATCAAFWDGLGRRASGGPGAKDLEIVVVTRDPSEESVASVAALAPRGVVVVMSSATWDALGVPGSPYVVQLRAGRVLGAGVAASWEQVAALVATARADEARATGERAAHGPEHRRNGPGVAHPERSEVDAALLAAGIGPGHPNLYGVPISPPPAGQPRPGGMRP